MEWWESRLAVFTLFLVVVFTLCTAMVMLEPGPEFLLLFRCQHLTDVLHHREMRQVEVDLFGGDGLEGLLHTGHIDRVRLEEWPEVHAHRGDLGLAPNDLCGAGGPCQVWARLFMRIASYPTV